MNEPEKENLYKLFRDHEEVMGASGTTLLALQSFREAITRLRCRPENFGDLVQELADLIKHTEPKIIPLVHLIEDFETEMQPNFGKSLSAAKSQALQILGRKIELFESYLERVIEQGMNLVKDGDVIIAHSPSSTVRKALVRAHTELHNRFRVLVLEQGFVRVKQLIQALSQAGVEHLVIPEHNLSHFLDQATKMLLGAISVTPDGKVVATVGSANIVGLCHLNGIPVYLLVNSLKFAHQSAAKQRIFSREREESREHVAYRHLSYSHDMVDFKLIDHVVTEAGELARE